MENKRITDNSTTTTTNSANTLNKPKKGEKIMTVLKTLTNIILFAALAFFCLTNLEEIKQFFDLNNLPAVHVPSPTKPDTPEIHVETQIINAMQQAHNDAYRYCEQSLETLKRDILYRVDSGAFDDYFSYTKTKVRDIRALSHDVQNFFDASHPSGTEVLAQELEQLITEKVIMPEDCQRRIEKITREAADIYMNRFSDELRKIQVAYNIPEPAWNEYITDICNQSQRIIVTGKGIDSKTKLVVAGSVVGGIKVAVPVAKIIAEKAGGKLAAKTAAKTATKTAAKGIGVAAANAVPVINVLIGAGFFAWDYFDFKSSADEAKRELRNAL